MLKDWDIKLIKKAVKKIKINFTLSHVLVSFVFLSLLSLVYIYYSYASSMNNIKKELIVSSYKIDNALMFEELDNLNTDNIFAAVFDMRGRIVFGNLPVDVDIRKDGFFRKSKYLFFISNRINTLSIPYRIITAYPLKNLYSNIKKDTAMYLPLSLLFSLIYGLFIYFLSGIWLKPVERTYANLEEFTEMFSHEVLTPVSTALFYIEDEKIRNSLIKSKDFLNSFLTFQKQQAFPWHKKNVNLKNTAQIIIRELTPLIDQKHIKIDADWKVEKIISNPELIYLILKNTIENAVKYAPNGSTVEIKSTNENKEVHITIVNENINYNKLTEKFESKNSFGLGLYITRKAIESLNGKIQTQTGEDVSISIHLPSC